MRNILLICSVFPPEEVTSAGMSVDLALALSKKNNVTVLRPRPSRPAGIDYSEKRVEYKEFKCITLKSYTCPYSKMLNRFWESTDFGIRSAYYIIKHHKNIDYIYNDGWHLFGLYIVSVVAKWLRIPYMVPIQDVYPESLLTKGININFLKKFVKTILFPLDHYTQKNAQLVRTNTTEMASYLSETRGISLDKYLVAYNWQNENDFSDYSNNRENNKIIFSYVGSINVHSNVDLIIKSFAKSKIKGSVMKIYGGGNKTNECKSIVEQLNLDNVTFGYVSRNEVPQIQSESDILILALPTGNGRLCLPSKLVSYMLSGKPVIASVDVDCEAAKIINESGCGIVVEPDNEDSFVEGIKKIAGVQREVRCKMGTQGREYAKRVLSKESNLGKVVSRINEFLDVNKQ